MTSDFSIVQDGKTAYVWGGWSASGYHTQMYVVDLLTGAVKAVPFGRIRFLAQGFVTNSAWTWVAGKLVYLAANGTMTQDKPNVGIVTVLGIAYSPTTVCLDPQPPKMALDYSPEMWREDTGDFFTDQITDFFK